MTLPPSRLEPTRPTLRWVSARSILCPTVGTRRIREPSPTSLTSTTVGLLPIYDIRGGTWGGTNGPSVPAAPGAGLVVGTVGTSNKWVEYAVGSGHVLGVADPYGWDIFTNGNPADPEPGPYYNPNNATAYLNFIETTLPIPEPGTFMLIGSGLVGLAAWRRLTQQSV